MSSVRAIAALGLVVLQLACTEAQRQRVSLPVVVHGTPAEPVTSGETTLLVEEASIVFGPLYLCAAPNPDLDSCQVALGQLLVPGRYDALDPAATPAGALAGVSGTALSAMWDYGRSWRLADSEPRPSAASLEGGASVRLVLRVTTEFGLRRVQIALPIDGGAQPSGTLAVRARIPTLRLSPEATRLEITFDPNDWARSLDVTSLATLPDGPEVTVPADHPLARSLTQALTLNALPSFTLHTAEP